MNLSPGTKLGPYEILSPLGAGGMGEVYRARDTRLGRDVAIKVLPEHLSAHPEVRTRFEREAKTVSALNHPNICTLFDVGREGDVDYLVMELVEGDTLATRLQKGALPLADAVRIGSQIADALDKAHRAGIVHRDLKPGNVMLTKAGAKLMDFGLARSAGLAGAGGATGETALTHSPTVGQPLTAEGTIVGTFQYMSPEQLEGREADARSDLWALGCVLYEMATGKRAFDGATQASLISSIMRDTPRPMAELTPMSPPALDRLVVTLLAKDPDDRIQTAHDVKLQLQWIGETPSSSASPAVAMPGLTHRRKAPVAWIVAALAVLAAAAAWAPSIIGGSRGGNAAHAMRTRLLIPEPANARLSLAAFSFAIAPDGGALTFVGVDSTGTARLWLRPLDELTPRVMDGTEHAEQPFWSPDGHWIGFFADGKLKRVSLDSGRVENLCDAPDPRGGAWGDGTIVFAPYAAGPLYSVSADGGTPELILRPDSASGENALRFPNFLPDGNRFTFSVLPRREGAFPIFLGHLGSGERTFLMLAGAAPVFAAPDWLITLEKERLIAQRINVKKGEVAGKPVTIGDAPVLGGHDSARIASASQNGVLAYWGGTPTRSQLAMLDRSGRVVKMYSLPVGEWTGVSVAPDGKRALVQRRNGAAETDLWMMDLTTGQASRFTFKPLASGVGVVWSPDGRRLVATNMTNGPADLLLFDAGTGKSELLYGNGGALFKNPYAWSPDGRYLTFEQNDRDTGWDVWMIDVDGDRTPQPLVQTPFNEGGGAFSPDGRWFAYYTNETGRYELCVRAFPDGGSRQVLSGMGTADTSQPFWWSRDGREILTDGSDGVVRVVDVAAGQTFKAGRTRDLFRADEHVIAMQPLPDHQTFLATVEVGEAQTKAIVIDINWTTALDAR
ncbi:MAG TPA: protein kinase [Candidatus Krumholzibacteria bacterium]|nr:protein kinase [Candidatus Krumholzibacteria bacterium]